MANMIELGGPTTSQMIGQFIDRFGADQRGAEQKQLQQQQLGIEQQRADQEKAYQTGQLGMQQSQLSQQQQIASAKAMLDGWQARMNEGDQTVQQEAQQYITEHPEMKPYLAAAAMFHASQGQQAQGVAQQKHLQDNQSVLAGNNDPNMQNVYTHDVTNSFMPAEGFKVQEGKALADQGNSGATTPNLAQRNPAPSGNAYTDTLSRDTGALASGPQNLQAQTGLQQTGMQIAANAPLISAQAREALARAAGQENTNKMLGSLTAQPTAAPGATPGSATQPGGPVSGLDQIAKDIAQRKYDPMLLRNLIGRDPGMAAMLEQKVQQFDPSFSMAEYPKQVANLKEYSQAGITGRSVTAVNTAIRHLNSYLNDLGQMGNTNYEQFNQLANPVSRAFGNTQVQMHGAEVDKDASAVANELNKAFRGSAQLSEKDTKDWQKGLSQNTTPAGGLGAASGAVKLLAGRLAEVASSYKRDTGLNPPQFLSPFAMKVLGEFKKKGVEGVDDLLQAAGADRTPFNPAAASQSNNADPAGLFQ